MCCVKKHFFPTTKCAEWFNIENTAMKHWYVSGMHCRLATDKELLSVHTEGHVEMVKMYSSQADDNVCKWQEKWKTYICDKTYQSASCAVGCALEMVDAICSGQVCVNQKV